MPCRRPIIYCKLCGWGNRLVYAKYEIIIINQRENYCYYVCHEDFLFILNHYFYQTLYKINVL